jgi:hypothetical protein
MNLMKDYYKYYEEQLCTCNTFMIYKTIWNNFPKRTIREQSWVSKLHMKKYFILITKYRLQICKCGDGDAYLNWNQSHIMKIVVCIPELFVENLCVALPLYYFLCKLINLYPKDQVICMQSSCMVYLPDHQILFL